MDEEQLYVQLLNHEEAAYHFMMDQYAKLLYAIAATFIPQRDQGSLMEIEEIVSDVFVRFWEHPEKFNPERGSLKSYLCVMVKSLTLNRIKKLKREEHVTLEEAGEILAIPSGGQDETSSWQFLYDAIMMLEEPTREILVRRFFHESKPKDIARQMNLPAKEVDNRLYRGKQQLKKMLLANEI